MVIEILITTNQTYCYVMYQVYEVIQLHNTTLLQVAHVKTFGKILMLLYINVRIW